MPRHLLEQETNVTNVTIVIFFPLCLFEKTKTKVTNVTIITIIPGCLWEQNKEKPMFQMLPLLPLFQGVCLKREQNESYKCYYYYYYSRLFVETNQRKNKVPNVTIVTFVPGCLLEKKKT